MGSAGRMVRCRLDCGGLRAAHDASCASWRCARPSGWSASGQPVLLEPLSSAERRVVHLELLRDRPGVSTESLGTGARKRIRISPV